MTVPIEPAYYDALWLMLQNGDVLTQSCMAAHEEDLGWCILIMHETTNEDGEVTRRTMTRWVR